MQRRSERLRVMSLSNIYNDSDGVNNVKSEESEEDTV